MTVEKYPEEWQLRSLQQEQTFFKSRLDIFEQSWQKLEDRLTSLEMQLPQLHAWRSALDGLQRSMVDWQKRIEDFAMSFLASAANAKPKKKRSSAKRAKKSAKKKSASKRAAKRTSSKKRLTGGKARR